MKSISPNMEKIGELIAHKSGSSKNDDKMKKKKKHLNFNFSKKKK